MDFLKQIALPQSEAQLGVLHLVMNVIYILLLPFISYLFGALVLSLYHNRRGRVTGNVHAVQYSREMIENIIPNKSILLLFGVVPFMALTFAYAQLLQQTSAISVSMMSWGLILFAAAAAFASSYHSALKLGGMFESVGSGNSVVETLKSEMSETRRTSGKYALIFLSLAVISLFSATSLAANPADWPVVTNIMQMVFTMAVLVKLTQFVFLSLTVASVGTLFFAFGWQGGKKDINNEYAEYVKNTALPTALITLLVQPIFVVLSLVALPVSALSGLVFLTAFLVIFFVFLASHFVYGMIKGMTPGHAGNAFFMMMLALIFIVIHTNTSFSNSTKKQSALLAYNYTLYHEELMKMLGISGAVLTGEDIFNAKCSACHEFGAKKVGPAYKDVLPKYENDRAKLLSFVMNPQKMNPAFPPMPNQGLKPAEADSIAGYIMMMYKKGK